MKKIKTPSKSFFLSESTDEWGGYKALRDLEKNQKKRRYLENLWGKWSPHADQHFQVECQKSEKKFNERFWEMYLGATLIEKSHEISSANSGPDICINDGKQKIWIEAVVASRGQEGKDNTVPEIHFSQSEVISGEIPDDKIRLRYLQAIRSKYCSRNKKGKRRGVIPYIIEGIIKKNDPVIIAVNSANIGLELSFRTPNIIKVCFGLGASVASYQINLYTKNPETVNAGYETQREIIKTQSTGEKIGISSSIFLQNEYPHISAIIFSYIELFRYPLDEKFIVIHNPFAKNPLKKGHLNIGTEYWYDKTHERILKLE